MRGSLRPRPFRRFVRAQSSPLVARWLRLSQVDRELAPTSPGLVESIFGRPHIPSAVLVHASREAILAPGFPEVVAELRTAIEVDHLTYAYGRDAFARHDSTSSYWCRLCDTQGPGLLVDHYTVRHPDDLPPPVDVPAALRTGTH